MFSGNPPEAFTPRGEIRRSAARSATAFDDVGRVDCNRIIGRCKLDDFHACIIGNVSWKFAHVVPRRGLKKKARPCGRAA